jgi:hypothetical protein
MYLEHKLKKIVQGSFLQTFPEVFVPGNISSIYCVKYSALSGAGSTKEDFDSIEFQYFYCHKGMKKSSRYLGKHQKKIKEPALLTEYGPNSWKKKHFRGQLSCRHDLYRVHLCKTIFPVFQYCEMALIPFVLNCFFSVYNFPGR